jgi:hypothetical protein
VSQLPLKNLPPEALEKTHRYVTAREYREFADWYAKEFRVRNPNESTETEKSR